MISDCSLTREQLDTCRWYFVAPEMTEAQALRRFDLEVDKLNKLNELNDPTRAPGQTAQDTLDLLIEGII